MLLEENQIAFHSDDGLIVDGVKDYSHQIAELIGLTSDSEFRHAGVSTLASIFFLPSLVQHLGGCLFVITLNLFSFRSLLIFLHLDTTYRCTQF